MSTWQIVGDVNDEFQISLVNNDVDNTNYCMDVDDYTVKIDQCREVDTQLFAINSDKKVGSKRFDNLCLFPVSKSLRLQPCDPINSLFKGKFLNFESDQEITKNKELLETALANEKGPPGIEESIKDLKAKGSTFFVIQRAATAVFNSQEINFEGVYVLNQNNQEFANERNPNMKMKINQASSSFEITLDNLASKLVMNENVKVNTILEANYFKKYKIVDYNMELNWCQTFAPCGAVNQCNKYKFGFKCRCNPSEPTFGPLCLTPTPCSHGPCRNNGRCMNIFHPDGNATFKCDCSTSPPGFRGYNCNICEGGIGVDGKCVKYNSCLANVANCATCDNESNPNICDTCFANRYYDPASNLCKDNVCVCNNGVLGDCLINNKYACASCDHGYVRTGWEFKN